MGDWALVSTCAIKQRPLEPRDESGQREAGVTAGGITCFRGKVSTGLNCLLPAQDDAFEWDQTDITLSTDQGLKWLQGIGIIPHHVRGPRKDTVVSIYARTARR
jgi:hypothetical protein